MEKTQKLDYLDKIIKATNKLDELETVSNALAEVADINNVYLKNVTLRAIAAELKEFRSLSLHIWYNASELRTQIIDEKEIAEVREVAGDD